MYLNINKNNNFHECVFLLFQPTETLLSHKELLYELIVYVNETFTNGEVSLDPYGHTLRENLYALYSEIKSMLCYIEIALRSLRHASPDLPSVDLSETFLGYRGTFETEIERIYGLMNDCRAIASFLSNIYSIMLSEMNK